MKKSELKAQIEELITEILSEVDSTTSQNKPSESPDVKIKKALGTKIKPDELTKATDSAIKPGGTTKDLGDLMTKAGLSEIEDDDDSSTDKEPTKSELRKNAGVAKVKDELAKVTKEMKDLAKEYTKAEGDKKDKIKTQLKNLTAKKKDLEKKLDKAL